MAQVDPNATIYNHADLENTAKPIHKIVSIKNYTEYFDMHTGRWGNRADKQERTVWSCYLKSDVIKPGLKELRNNYEIQAILEGIHCKLFPHMLKESQTMNIGHLVAKDPDYTYRREIEQRLSDHLADAAYNLDKSTSPPIQIDTTRVKAEDTSALMCSLFVGRHDELKVKELLANAPTPFDVEILPAEMKRREPKEFSIRIQQHLVLVEESRAIKLEHLDLPQLTELRKWKTQDQMFPKVIDISMARHFQNSGVVYVQYIGPFKDEVTKWVQAKIYKLQQDHKPRLASTNNSVAPTLATNATEDVPFPTSKYECFLS